MTTLDDREKAFENKFAHDEELMFKARARRNRIVGEWAAGELGIGADDLQSYIADVVKSDLEEDGDQDVIRKIHADFEREGVDISDHRIHKQMDAAMVTAKQQIMSET